MATPAKLILILVFNDINLSYFKRNMYIFVQNTQLLFIGFIEHLKENS